MSDPPTHNRADEEKNSVPSRRKLPVQKCRLDPVRLGAVQVPFNFVQVCSR
jgi:hypothetical protein